MGDLVHGDLLPRLRCSSAGSGLNHLGRCGIWHPNWHRAIIFAEFFVYYRPGRMSHH
jgi:hypothetical protein